MFLRQLEGHHSIIIITFKQLCNLFSSQRDLKRKTPLIQRENDPATQHCVLYIKRCQKGKVRPLDKLQEIKLLFIIKLIKSDSKVIYDIKMYISISRVTEELSNGC